MLTALHAYFSMPLDRREVKKSQYDGHSIDTYGTHGVMDIGYRLRIYYPKTLYRLVLHIYNSRYRLTYLW